MNERTSTAGPSLRGVLLLAVLLAVCAQANISKAQRKAGRNGAAFLEISVGARAAALGSAVTAMTGGANQIFWNPAGTALTDEQQATVALSYNNWIGGLRYTSAAAGYNLGFGTVTVGVQAFGISDIPANRENGYEDPILQELVTDPNTAPTYDYLDLAFSTSYAQYFARDRLALGATVKYIRESIDGISASAVAFDFGSVYRVGFAGWQLGARLSNLGTSITFYNQENPLPLTFSIGTCIYPVSTERTRLMLSVDVIKPQDSQQLVYGGAEISFFDFLFLRGGYKFNYSGVKDGGTATRGPIETSLEDFSLGGGIQYVLSGTAMAIDYAFTKMNLFDDAHRFTVHVRF